MIRNLVLSILLIIIFLCLFIGCHVKNPTQTDSKTSNTIDKSEFRMPSDTGSELSPQTIQNIKDTIIKNALPIASGEDNVEFKNIIQYLDDIQEKVPTYFDDDDHTIKFYKTIMRAYILAARLSPDDFDVNLDVATAYTKMAFSAQYSLVSESAKRFSDEYKKKGIQAAKNLMNKFPDQSLSYGHMAHTIHITGGDRKEVISLLNQCLDIDKESEYCKDFIAKLTK